MTYLQGECPHRRPEEEAEEAGYIQRLAACVFLKNSVPGLVSKTWC